MQRPYRPATAVAFFRHWSAFLALLVVGTATLVPRIGVAADDEPAKPAADGSPDDAPAEAKPASAGDDVDAGKRSALTRELAEQGEADLQKSVRVFQQRYLLKAGRVELNLGGGMSIADPMIKHYARDATLLVHLSGHFAIGAGASWWKGDVTPQFSQIERDFGLFPEKSTLQAGGHGQIQWSPLVGKFSSFGLAVLQVDGYMLVGGGAARTSRGEALKPFGMVGFGLRIHTLRWLTLSFEVRDMLMPEKFIAEDRLLQHVFAGAQLGIWLPPSVHYKYPR